MSRFVSQSYYEILDLDPGANASAIRTAFREAQRNFDPASPVLHSMYDPDAAAAINAKLIEAFEILAGPERRARYDRYLAHKAAGFRARSPDAFFNEAHKAEEGEEVGPPRLEPRAETGRPQLRAVSGGEQAAPADTGNRVRQLKNVEEPPPTPPDAPSYLGFDEIEPELQPASPETRPSRAGWSGSVAAPARTPPPVKPIRVRTQSSGPLTEEELERLVQQHGWSGHLLRAARERGGITLEDLSHTTKINIQYLRSIENHAYEELPAPVYLRGFLRQVAQLLKLPALRFVDGYLALMNKP